MDSRVTVNELLGQIMDIINTLEEQEKARQIAELLGAISAIHEMEVKCLQKR